jgi:hypothetical protein
MRWIGAAPRFSIVATTGATFMVLRTVPALIACVVFMFVMAFSALNHSHGNCLHIDSGSSCVVVHRDKKEPHPLPVFNLVTTLLVPEIPFKFFPYFAGDKIFSSFIPLNVSLSRAPPL